MKYFDEELSPSFYMENKMMDEYKKIINFLSKDPESSKVLISGFVNQYKPLLYIVLNEFWGLWKDLVNNDEYFDTLAKYEAKKVAALQEQGFSRDEAFSILLANKRNFQNYGNGFQLKYKN